MLDGRFAAGFAALGACAAFAQIEASCPKAMPEGAACYSGRDERGAYYWLVRPKNWNGVLVVHSHWGPTPNMARPTTPGPDLGRFAGVGKAGFAGAGSAYRRSGSRTTTGA